MGDPLSVVASVLTVAGVAVTACECLHKKIRRIAEAPKEIEHHLAAVQALHSVFTGISTIARDIPDFIEAVPGIQVRIHACIHDLEKAEAFFDACNKRLEHGKARRAWGKIRWSSTDDQQTLKSHISRIESYYMTFSLDLLLLNMYVMINSNGLYMHGNSLTSGLHGLQSAQSSSQGGITDPPKNRLSATQVIGTMFSVLWHIRVIPYHWTMLSPGIGDRQPSCKKHGEPLLTLSSMGWTNSTIKLAQVSVAFSSKAV